MLTDEKERIKEAAVRLHDKYSEILNMDHRDDTYFKPYDECKHFDEEVSEYNSDELTDLKDILMRLWNSDDDMIKEIMPVLLVAYNKTRDYGSNYLNEVDMINYML